MSLYDAQNKLLVAKLEEAEETAARERTARTRVEGLLSRAEQGRVAPKPDTDELFADAMAGVESLCAALDTHADRATIRSADTQTADANSGAGFSAAGDRQASPALIETVSRLLFSSDYHRKVDRTTDIAGRLPNAVYTLPPRLVQAIVGLADVTDATREALVAECKKFYLADRQYEESKEVFVDWCCGRCTTVTLDCGRLYSEGFNGQGQCGIGSEVDEVTGPCLIRLPPVLQVWHHNGSCFR